jgi:signal transduction histidine kinase
MRVTASGAGAGPRASDGEASPGRALDRAGLTLRGRPRAGQRFAIEVGVSLLLVVSGVAAGMAVALPSSFRWLIALVWAGFALMGVLNVALHLRFGVLLDRLARQEIRNAELGHEREALIREALTVSERERQRLAADLHDGVIQLVSAVTLRTATVGRGLRRHAGSPARVEEAAASLDRITVDLQAVTADLRTLMGALAGEDLAVEGLTGALSSLLLPLAETGVAIDLSVGEVVCDPEIRRLIHRAAQELVRNVAKHAFASRVTVSVSQGSEGVVMRLSDDGRGYDPGDVDQSRPTGHLGLRLLEQRVRDAGGVLRIDSGPGRGTSAEVTLPLAAAAHGPPASATGVAVPA